MSEFSEHLTRIKVKYDIVISHLSDAMEIDRTTLHNYFSGKRLPTGEDFINKLAIELRLPITETDKLREELYIARNGEDKTEIYNCIESIIKRYSLAATDIPDFINSAPRTNMSLSVPECSVVTKKEKLLRIIAFAIEENFVDGGDTYIVAQPSETLCSVFSSVAAHNPKSSIYHIFCLSSEKNIDSPYNLELTKRVLVAYSNLSEYCPLFYYDNISSARNEINVFGNCIVTPRLLVTFDDNCENAIMCKNKDIISAYIRLCKDRRKRCMSLIKKKSAITDYIKDFLNERQSEQSYYFHPCIALALDKAMLKSLIRLPEPLKSTVAEKTVSQFEKYRKRNPEESGSFVLFSEKGIEHFLHNGRITEIPDSLYFTPSPQQRIALVERSIRLCEEGAFRPRIITDENIAPSLRLGLSVFNDKELLITIHSDDGTVRSVSLNEKDIVNSVRDYLIHIFRSDRVMNAEDTISAMKRAVEDYKLTLESENDDEETTG